MEQASRIRAITFVCDEAKLVYVFARFTFDSDDVFAGVQLEFIFGSTTASVERGVKGLAVATVTELNSIDIFTSTQANSDELCGQDVVNKILVVEGRSTGPTLKGGDGEAAVVRLKRNEHKSKSKVNERHTTRLVISLVGIMWAVDILYI